MSAWGGLAKRKSANRHETQRKLHQAPAGFSTTTCWPSTSASPCATMRPATSLGAPAAANGTIMVSVRFGRVCEYQAALRTLVDSRNCDGL